MITAGRNPIVCSILSQPEPLTKTLKLTPDALSAHLEQQLLRAYLISGDEPLLAGEAADAVRAAARAKGFTERDVHFLERGSDWDDVRASAGNMSLFGSRRVIEIRMPTGKPGVAGSAALVSMLGVDDRDSVFLILTPRLDRDAQNSNWVKAVEAHGAWVQVWPIDADRIVTWLRARARRSGLDICNPSFDCLPDLVPPVGFGIDGRVSPRLTATRSIYEPVGPAAINANSEGGEK